jgi:hypothetical protein
MANQPFEPRFMMGNIHSIMMVTSIHEGDNKENHHEIAHLTLQHLQSAVGLVAIYKPRLL